MRRVQPSAEPLSLLGGALSWLRGKRGKMCNSGPEGALAGISLPAHPGVLAAPASMPAGAASRYALGDGGVGAARPAPAASLISASRYALGARRSAPRALRACVPGGAAAGCHRRLALRARRRWRGRCAPGRLWQPGRRLALRARRRRHGRCAPGRPGAYMYMLSPPITARVASWWWGCRRRRALRAARNARCKARFALLPRARVGRGGPEIIMRERAGERSCAAAACAVRVGAEHHSDRSAFSPGQADPPRFQRACCSASRSSRAHTSCCVRVALLV